MTRSSLSDDHFRCSFYGFDVLWENKSVTYITYLKNTRSRFERRAPRKHCDLRYQCGKLVVFKARRGFHFTRNTRDIPTNKRPCWVICTKWNDWQIEERITKWQRIILTGTLKKWSTFYETRNSAKIFTDKWQIRSNF